MALLTESYGCLFIALFFSFIIFGFVLLWIFQYFARFPKDSLFIKTMVLTLGVFGSIHISTSFAWIYDKLINKYPIIFELDPIPATALVQLACIFVIAFLSQSYFVTRIWILSKGKLWMTLPIFVLAILQLGLGFWIVVRAGTIGHFTLVYKMKTLVIVTESFTVTCDLATAAALCYLLATTRSRISETDSLVTRLVIASLNRGLLTTVLAIAVLATFLYKPESMIYELALNPLGQTYILNVLSVLHSRKKLRGKFSGTHFISTQPSCPTNLEQRRESYDLSVMRKISIGKGSRGGSEGEGDTVNNGEDRVSNPVPVPVEVVHVPVHMKGTSTHDSGGSNEDEVYNAC